MSIKLSSYALAAILGLASGHVLADVFVICNSGTQIAAGEIKDVFTGEKQLAGSTKLVPVDNGPAQSAFLASVLKIDAARYGTIWTKKSFREGLTQPAVKSGDGEVLDFVRKTPGAVGYVTSQPSGVNIIQKF
ncbi:MAG: phosphate ABC transporter substrate-binding protein [Proteobacteria bacterium]|nr:phosphate ABC transporter substrate-binding protein [Pseudomonadota bacterium]